MSRNKGIKFSKGNYICFIDADDKWENNKLEKQIQFMKANNYLISHTSYKIINEKNNVIGFRKARTFKNLNELLKSCDWSINSILNEKILSKNIKFPDLKTKEDFG